MSFFATRGLVASLVPLCMLGAFGQYDRACPSYAVVGTEAKTWCAKMLSPDGSILLKDSLGRGCTYRCPARLGSTGAELQAAAELRRAEHIANFLEYASASSWEWQPDESEMGLVGSIDASGNVNWDSGYKVCAMHRSLACMVNKLTRSGFYSISTLRFNIEAQDGALAFPGTASSPLNDTTTFIRITVPNRFIRSEATGNELLLFMLLHEWGHGAATANVNDYGSNEYAADMWAVHEGLPTYFGQAWPIIRDRFLDQVADQLKAHLLSQFVGDDGMLATDITAQGDQYPELECRIAGIRGERVPLVQRTLGYEGYPGYCWDDAIQGIPRFNRFYVAKACEDEGTGLGDSCTVRFDLGTNPDKRRIWADELENICAYRPELCDSNGSLKAPPRSWEPAKRRFFKRSSLRSQDAGRRPMGRATWH